MSCSILFCPRDKCKCGPYATSPCSTTPTQQPIKPAASIDSPQPLTYFSFLLPSFIEKDQSPKDPFPSLLFHSLPSRGFSWQEALEFAFYMNT
ncbi:hypothetical protein RIF29_29490 [Crotalaria pallida]|uniref:Uncharacterized protein n=1 Tax=Crotalaria pallida TaxID=3830 RepID=A0AAN9HVY6_CROPI